MQDSELLVWDAGKTQLQTKLGELVQYFQLNLPSAGDGSPRSYIDPTVLMPYLLEIDQPDDVPDRVIGEATIPIDVDEGFPTVCGIPLWERFDGEPIPYYKLLKAYRELKYETGTRSIAKLAETCDLSGRALNALARIYHWQMRVKAYDKYKDQQRAVMKQREVEKLENKHASVSNQLLDQAVDYLLKHPEQLSPKTAIDLMQLAMKSGRLAVGLNPDKPGSGGESSGGRGTNITIQNTANAADNMTNVNIDGLSETERKVKENSQDVSHLQSILHVLNQSGAFNVANAKEADVRNIEDEDEYIDADYESVDEE